MEVEKWLYLFTQKSVNTRVVTNTYACSNKRLIKAFVSQTFDAIMNTEYDELAAQT